MGGLVGAKTSRPTVVLGGGAGRGMAYSASTGWVVGPESLEQGKMFGGAEGKRHLTIQLWLNKLGSKIEKDWKKTLEGHKPDKSAHVGNISFC